MRRLTFIVLALAATYGGYWFFASSALSNGITGQISAMQDDGWTVQTTDLATKGFPSRFDTSAANIMVATPDRDFVWRAPFAQANALAYRPNEVILVLPEHQEIELGGNVYQIASDGLRAQIGVSANPALDLASFTAQTGPLNVDGLKGELLAVSSGLIAVRPTSDAKTNTYDLYANFDELALSSTLRRMLDPRSALPETFSQTTFDGTVTFSEPLNRHALMDMENLVVDGVKVNGLTLSWGALSLRAKGEITIDRAGIPTGTLTLTARNWSQMLDIAVRIGMIDQGLVRTVKNMATLMAGGSQDLDVPISFQNGMMSLGPIPAGPAPRFR